MTERMKFIKAHKEYKDTRRYCTQCKLMTDWSYNPQIKHSLCNACNARSIFARRFEPKSADNNYYEKNSHSKEDING